MAKTSEFHLLEATIDSLQEALANGSITSIELTALYLNRIHFYDRNNLRINAVPLLNERALEEARERDKERTMGKIRGPLHGIPFTVKDSYMVKGMTVAAGSPAFAYLEARNDSFVVERLRAAGAILLGKTNMPPMAAGGMQSGLYGRSENPYNTDYLAAAWFSGSSHGSAVATASNFAVFGMAEETVSSGRSPASNNALVAYTPSRGLISIRGNWPLFPTRDVVVPHSRTMTDLLHILNVIVVEDQSTDNDFWRAQEAVALPSISSVRPQDFLTLKQDNALKGKRLGVPKCYIGKGDIYIRPSILELWERSVDEFKNLGAEIIEVDFPLQALYEQDSLFLQPLEEKGYLPKGWMLNEWYKVNSTGVEQFLQSIMDPQYPTWKDIDGASVFPNPRHSVYERQGKNHAHYLELIELIREGITPYGDIPDFEEALQGLERARKELFEDWLDELQLDALVFPSNCNIGRSTAEIDEQANAEAWENGSYFSNGNYFIRHLGIPTVSLPMGIMEDTQVPVGLTFAGKAYADNILLSFGYAFEQQTQFRQPPALTPSLSDEVIPISIKHVCSEESSVTLTIQQSVSHLTIEAVANTIAASIRLFINGEKVAEGEQKATLKIDVPIARFTPPFYQGNGKLYVNCIVKSANNLVDVVESPFHLTPIKGVPI